MGLIPAAGYGTRLGLSYSKEIQPIGRYAVPEGTGTRPKVVSHYLLDRMRIGGVDHAYFVIRDGKWDIPAHFTDGALAGLPVGYLLVTVPYGAPYTLDAAYPFVRGSLVALGFPDILFSPDDGFARIVARQARSGADVVLGVFPTDRPHAVDVVALDESGRITHIEPKPRSTALRHTWGIAVWTADFTEFLHRFLAERPVPEEGAAELFVGDVIQAARTAGMTVEGVQLSDVPYVDIGTPETLARVLRDHRSQEYAGPAHD